MTATFRLTVRFLDAAFHGRADGGEPEWPPSPLRAFQALVAAAAARWRPAQFEDYARPALEWLEALDHPDVSAPVGRAADQPYRLYVPNNAADLVAAAWARGNPDASIAEHRTEKDVRPTRFTEGQPVHYDWPLTPDQLERVRPHLQTLKDAARSITHLGWGVDQACGSADLLDSAPEVDPRAERWQPVPADGTPLRVPKPGTLADLRDRHQACITRLERNGFKPVPPPVVFDVVSYRRATDPPGRAWAAFRISSVDPDEPNPAFDTPRRCRDVSAWVRHATAAVCDGWPFGDTAGFVHGHDAHGNQLTGDGADDRFMYLPLPTINHKLNRVESIRRVLVAAPPRFADRVEWVRRRLPGQDLHSIDERIEGILNILPTSDWVLRQYTGASRAWSTVTPVVMPGHDGGDPAKAERLLRRAFEQSGLPPELVTSAGLEWRAVGFRPGVDLAQRYCLPESPKKLPTYHVRVRFPASISGPLAVGAGRYRGFGLFASERLE